MGLDGPIFVSPPETSCALMDPFFASPPETSCFLLDPKTSCLLMDPLSHVLRWTHFLFPLLKPHVFWWTLPLLKPHVFWWTQKTHVFWWTHFFSLLLKPHVFWWTQKPYVFWWTLDLMSFNGPFGSIKRHERPIFTPNLVWDVAGGTAITAIITLGANKISITSDVPFIAKT
jgi:hypothetical protein